RSRYHHAQHHGDRGAAAHGRRRLPAPADRRARPPRGHRLAPRFPRRREGPPRRRERALEEDRLIGERAASALAAAVGDYRERPAGGPLAEHLACLWTQALPDAPMLPLQVFPDGCIDIIWTGGDLRVAGPDSGPVLERIAPGTVLVGLRFRPGAAPPWLGVP